MGIFSKKETENLTAKAIVEIIGKPKEHIEKTMEIVVENMKKNSSWKVMSSKITETEQKENFYATFADVEVSFKTFGDLLSFCFEYLPSSIEITEPHEFNLTSVRMNGWINDFLGRLHESDMVAKRVRADNELLQMNTTQIFRNFLKHALKDGEKPRKQLAAITGIPENDVDKFLAQFIGEELIEKTEKGYKLV